MDKQNLFTIINQQDGNLAFKIFTFRDNSYFDHLQRNNFYTVVWVKEGNGLLKVDFSEYTFEKSTFFAFSPFQPFMFSTDTNIKGIAIQFHSDFYCIHRNPEETSCDTVLFNNIYQAPFFSIDKEMEKTFDFLIEQLKSEVSGNENQNYELLIPNLKVFLGNASRIKSRSQIEKPQFLDTKTPFLLKNLKSEIEINFKEKHSASDYADLLNISSNALAKLVKSHYSKTLTELITERIIIEAKRELYMTNKPVKEIAWSLGYTDEFYFSRLFKTNTDISPQLYRETVGFGKAELN
jgi:AraC family transcriptional activator of pobA